MSKDWIKVWTANYLGQTDESKELETLLKKNYKGHKYVPWATMQRLLYQQDPDAELDLIETDSGEQVHENYAMVEKEVDGKRTEIRYNAFFVKYRCVFLGKEFIETYPVQDNAYNAPNYYDSNMVNKSLQRAKAKVISAATGIAFKLYEDGDLQFEDDTPKVEKPSVRPKKVEVVETKEVEKVEVEKTAGVEMDGRVVDLAEYIISHKDTLMPILQKVNETLFKKHNIVINPELGRNSVMASLEHISNIALFEKSLKKQHEDLKKG